MTTSYEVCSMEFNDTATQLSELLDCMSTADADSRKDVATGLDAFFLIYAGALVLYVYIFWTMATVGVWLLVDIAVFALSCNCFTHARSFRCHNTILNYAIDHPSTALCKLVLPCFVLDPSVPKMPRMVSSLHGLACYKFCMSLLLMMIPYFH